MRWSEAARDVIASVAKDIPRETPLAERRRIIDAAYPFGPRDYWPYKAWCKARRAYLERWGLKPIRRAPEQIRFEDLPRDPVTGRPVIR